MPNFPQIGALIALFLFAAIGLTILVVAIRTMSMGTIQALDMLGAFVVVSLGLVVVVPIILFIVFAWMWQNTVVEGPAAHYAQTQMAVVAGVRTTVEQPTATQTQGPTVTQVVVVLPSATAATGPDGLVVFPQTEVHLVNGNTLTVYENGVARQATGRFYACGWLKGYLVACPPDGHVLFVASQVTWQTEGVPMPPATSTPAPTPQPTVNPTVEAASCENLWMAWTQAIPEDVRGAALVPVGHKARLVGPGLIGLAPGNQPWKLEVSDLPNAPSIQIGDKLAKTIPGSNWNGSIEFTGTGDQCLP